MKDKTNAELALMGSKTDKVSNEIIANEDISTIIDKDDTHSIIEWLQYVNAKRKINNCNKKEKDTIDNVVNGLKKNGLLKD